MERTIDRKFDRKMAKKINSALDPLEVNMEEQLKAAASSGGWKTPFVLLLVIIAVFMGVFYKKYRYLTKNHLL